MAFIGIILFGGFGLLYAVPRMRRREVTIVLTAGGLEQLYPEGRAYVPWSDIEKVGVVSSHRAKIVGIKLKTYERYLQAIPPTLADSISKMLPYMKLLAGAAAMTSIVGDMSSSSILSEVQDLDDQRTLASSSEIQNLAGYMLWTRRHFGYDLLLGWAEIDRPAPAFAALLQQYLPKSR